ncbi:MAG TPA: hypothetical protein VGC71_15360 [Gaiellales bacterium]|jgi:hypothetical protein
MTTHPAPTTPDQDVGHGLRRRAWQEYLDATRDSERYEDDELDAWNRLQDRLEDIEAELVMAHSAD